jgi:hypothetical protein
VQRCKFTPTAFVSPFTLSKLSQPLEAKGKIASSESLRDPNAASLLAFVEKIGDFQRPQRGPRRLGGGHFERERRRWRPGRRLRQYTERRRGDRHTSLRSVPHRTIPRRTRPSDQINLAEARSAQFPGQKRPGMQYKSGSLLRLILCCGLLLSALAPRPNLRRSTRVLHVLAIKPVRSASIPSNGRGDTRAHRLAAVSAGLHKARSNRLPTAVPVQSSLHEAQASSRRDSGVSGHAGNFCGGQWSVVIVAARLGFGKWP